MTDDCTKSCLKLMHFRLRMVLRKSITEKPENRSGTIAADLRFQPGGGDL